MGELITLLIGHRGVGKSSLLESLKAWTTQASRPFTALDLDQEIARASGETIADILSSGEERFRKIEVQTLHDLVSHAQGPTMIAVGAGFQGPMPQNVRVLWLRRLTDRSGRSFLDRPRLNAKVSPFEEYHERFQAREERYASWAHEQLILPEGYDGGLEAFALGDPLLAPFDLTLMPENFRDWDRFYKRRRDWGIRRWELRDDLLSPEDLARAIDTIPHDKIIFSRRIPQGRVPMSIRPDWPLELGAPVNKVFCLSLHERREDFTSTLERLTAFASSAEITKLSVEVKDFVELQIGHEWWMQDPEHRAFLPRSSDGRWRWYRSLFGPRMPLHYFREGDGSAGDQPLLWQILLQTPFKENFAAVLGSPVEHSRTPMEQLAFFRTRGMPVVTVDVPEAECAVAFEFLRRLGLTHAAVTAPLKKLAWASANQLSSEARQTQAANTLRIYKDRIEAHNTDVLALKQLASKHSGFSPVWLWGGGGIKTSVSAAWPDVTEISAREGIVPRGSPQMVIWATGRSRRFEWPSADIRPKLVLDLNYGEDSPGLEWAVRENLPYQSGLEMFKLQAEFQRAYWAES